MDSGLREHEELVKQYFGTIIPSNDNKFAALNTAVWSGGSFIYVPPGVKIELPLQAYFRINAENMGQFERTMILVDEGAYVHYVEGCTAPIYSSDSLHSAVVEIVVKKGGRCRYTTIQNWSNNVYNLVTKRAVAYEDATMEWVDGNLGSKLTMKYPAIWLMGPRAHGEVLSIAFAGAGQHQDAGGKVVHVAPDTTSLITSKSISKDGGRAGYRGLLQVAKGATNAKSKVVCDALILDERLALRHLPLHRHRRERGRHRPRGDRLQDRRRAALLPHVARSVRIGSLGDDRLRVRRADRQGAPARVRDRDEPADPDPDGRLRRLTHDRAGGMPADASIAWPEMQEPRQLDLAGAAALPVADVLAELGSSEAGLSSVEAQPAPGGVRAERAAVARGQRLVGSRPPGAELPARCCCSSRRSCRRSSATSPRR